MSSQNSIKCPDCGALIDVNQVLYQQLQNEIKQDFQNKTIEQEKIFRSREENLKSQINKFEKNKIDFDQIVETKLGEKLKIEKGNLEKNIRQKVEEENSELIKQVQNELNHKSNEVKELNKIKAENEKLKRETNELSEKISLQKEKEFSEKFENTKESLKAQLNEQHLLKQKEQEKTIDDLKNKVVELNQRMQQGSIQLQGEVQELVLANILREAFIYDEIQEIKTGQRGADVLQIVKTANGENCGKIYFESKRTKNFEANWLAKFREDNLEIKADILVLVTQTMPDQQNSYFFKDGVWICKLSEVKGLLMVLRYGLLQVHSMKITQQGRESKMEEIYNYITGNEFVMRLSAVIEDFNKLRENFNIDKQRTLKLLKERENQIDKILKNTVEVYGSLKGIAGKSMPDIKLLEDDQSFSL